MVVVVVVFVAVVILRNGFAHSAFCLNPSAVATVIFCWVNLQKELHNNV